MHLREPIIDFVLLITLFLALYVDLKKGKIYNKITFSGIILGIILNLLGERGVLFSLKGLSLGLGIFIIPYALGGLGAGDIKLLGAIGALKGIIFVFWASLISASLGGIIAILMMLRRKAFLSTTKGMLKSIYNLVIFRAPLDLSPKGGSFPYALAIVGGTLLTLILEKRGSI